MGAVCKCVEAPASAMVPPCTAKQKAKLLWSSKPADTCAEFRGG